MNTTNDEMREQGLAEGRAIADRLAPKIVEAASVLPDAQAAVTPVLEAEVALAASQRNAAGASEAGLRQFTMALVAGLAERLDEIASEAAGIGEGRLH